MEDSVKIGDIVSVGYVRPRWIHVTRLTKDTVTGHVYNFKYGDWTKDTSDYHRHTINMRPPRSKPPEYSD